MFLFSTVKEFLVCKKFVTTNPMISTSTLLSTLKNSFVLGPYLRLYQSSQSLHIILLFEFLHLLLSPVLFTLEATGEGRHWTCDKSRLTTVVDFKVQRSGDPSGCSSTSRKEVSHSEPSLLPSIRLSIGCVGVSPSSRIPVFLFSLSRFSSISVQSGP